MIANSVLITETYPRFRVEPTPKIKKMTLTKEFLEIIRPKPSKIEILENLYARKGVAPDSDQKRF